MNRYFLKRIFSFGKLFVSLQNISTNIIMDKIIEKPKRVIVEITNRCNFRCIHCFANKNDFELKVESWKKIFENICKENIQSITITGGEPLLYKDLFVLLKNVKIKTPKKKTLIQKTIEIIYKSKKETAKIYFFTAPECKSTNTILKIV